MSLFTCCVSKRKQQQEKSDAEARHARIMEIYTQARTSQEAHTSLPAAPPAYEEVVYDTLSGTTIVVDEKGPGRILDEAAQHTHVARIPRPESPQTSIYSVPSTRLTDITSAHTGATVVAGTQRGDSPRSSLVFDSAPPSYWDGRSIRDRSRSPARHSEEGQNVGDLHPVMTENWLERLLIRGEHDFSGQRER